LKNKAIMFEWTAVVCEIEVKREVEDQNYPKERENARQNVINLEI